MASTLRPAAAAAAAFPRPTRPTVPRTASDTASSALLDPAVDYALAPGVAVLRRGATTVQIGTETARRFLLTDAPDCARAVLAGLDGTASVGDAVCRAGGRLAEWLPVLTQLAVAGLLIPASAHPRPAPQLRAERLSLIEQYGVAAADRMLAARSDAVVVVEGAGVLAASAAELLAAAGIGYVHVPRRPSDEPAADRPIDLSATGMTASVAPRTVPPRTAPDPSAPRHAAYRFAAVRPYPPAPQTHPSAVLLAGAGGPDVGRAAELVAAVVPHLAVRCNPARIVVGPLVLPGRSACLNCVDRHRTDADPGWPRVAAANRAWAAEATPRALHSAAVIATEQILELIDGVRCPETVDGTVERRAGSLYPRRRPWARHPDCRCMSLAQPLRR